MPVVIDSLMILILTVVPLVTRDDPFLTSVILNLQDQLLEQWFTFGLHIGLNPTTLNALSENQYSAGGFKTCTIKMLIKWRSIYDNKATWKIIIDALRLIQHNRLANQLEEHIRQVESSDSDEDGYFTRKHINFYIGRII